MTPQEKLFEIKTYKHFGNQASDTLWLISRVEQLEIALAHYCNPNWHEEAISTIPQNIALNALKEMP